MCYPVNEFDYLAHGYLLMTNRFKFTKQAYTTARGTQPQLHRTFTFYQSH